MSRLLGPAWFALRSGANWTFDSLAPTRMLRSIGCFGGLVSVTAGDTLDVVRQNHRRRARAASDSRLTLQGLSVGRG